MSLSLIKPEPRPIFSIFSKIWLILIAFLIIILTAINLFIIYKNYSLKNQTQELATTQISLGEETAKIDEISEILGKQIEIASGINASNAILKQSLHNLFDLVPDSITLEEVLMDRTSLIIRGVTPTKDVFNQLLASPLKSIFNTSNNSFYQIKNGWYGFVSTNKMDNSEGYNE
ncbi:hypothetical protein [Campylobacter gastrosuis]|uniref:Uncharacterized protein n=1 Tax=Campylobacter gastrosuis TaxID=2974576 RepID=A0ABT7HMI5_9BACT|nr:hypothetical protein [Campylobacter gastrosuis]MDL0088131.1 hypothetical protein [Campylobacter gastrosuis]